MVPSDQPGLLDAGNKYLSIADLSCASASRNGANRRGKSFIGHYKFDFGFWNEIQAVLATTIDFHSTVLASESVDFGDSQIVNPKLC